MLRPKHIIKSKPRRRNVLLYYCSAIVIIIIIIVVINKFAEISVRVYRRIGAGLDKSH